MHGVLHIGYTMCTCGLLDICTLGPWACGPRASGVYIRQATRAHGITIKCNTFTPHIKASSHATYIMLYSLGMLQLPMECGIIFHWNADSSVISRHTVVCQRPRKTREHKCVSRHTVVCQRPRKTREHKCVIYATGQVAVFSLS